MTGPTPAVWGCPSLTTERRPSSMVTQSPAWLSSTTITETVSGYDNMTTVIHAIWQHDIWANQSEMLSVSRHISSWVLAIRWHDKVKAEPIHLKRLKAAVMPAPPFTTFVIWIDPQLCCRNQMARRGLHSWEGYRLWGRGRSSCIRQTTVSPDQNTLDNILPTISEIIWLKPSKQHVNTFSIKVSWFIYLKLFI